MQSYLHVFPSTHDPAKGNLASLGWAVLLIDESGARHAPGYLDLVEAATRLGHLMLHRDGNGQVVGFLIWAFLAPETEMRIRATGVVCLHPSEWDEGERPWILGICAPAAHHAALLAELCREIGVAKDELEFYNPPLPAA